MVDDASTDESVKIVQSSKFKVQSYSSKWSLHSFVHNVPKIKIIKNERNLGFASTVNHGVIEAHGEFVVLLNTDVVPEKDFIAPLVKHFENEKVFAVGCVDRSVEGSKVVLRGRGIGKWERGFLMHSRGEVDRTDTLWVSGGSGAFRKSIWEELGGFDTLYNPFYWEDIDLSYRAQKMGYILFFEPKSVVIHEHGKGAILKNYSPLYVKTIAYRNQFIFIWKNVSDVDFVLSHLFWLPYHIGAALVRLDVPFLYGMLLAILKFALIMNKRVKLKKLHVVTDKEILNQFV